MMRAASLDTLKEDAVRWEIWSNMFDVPVVVPDHISTLELSKIWLYKAFQNLEQELNLDRDDNHPNQNETLEEEN